MAKAIQQSSWQADLRLRYQQRGQKTVLSQRQQRGPLAVQRPFYPEDSVCHTYLLHPPGGVVGGDQLFIGVDVEPNAHVLLTTPGATKFYRSTGLQAQQQQQFQLHDGCLEFLPQENIFFPAAQVTLDNRIQLFGKAAYIGWDIQCLGRPAISETFKLGALRFKTAIYHEQQLRYTDRFTIQHTRDLHSASGLRNHPVFATLYAYPASAQSLEVAREHCNTLTASTAGTTIVNEVLIVRYLGDSTAEAQRLLRQIWQAIRPDIIGRVATPPRIWNT